MARLIAEQLLLFLLLLLIPVDIRAARSFTSGTWIQKRPIEVLPIRAAVMSCGINGKSLDAVGIVTFIVQFEGLSVSRGFNMVLGITLSIILGMDLLYITQ